MMLVSSAETLTNDQKLDEVELARQDLASLNPDDDAYLPALDSLAEKLVSRFKQSRSVDDLNESISWRKQLVDLSPPGNSYHLAALGNLGGSFRMLFKLLGDANDLTQAINYFEAGVEACTPEEPFYLQMIGSLASGLLNRYWNYGDVKDLDRIIDTGLTALSTSPQSPHRDILLNNLATALRERFTKQGNKADLDEALRLYHSCLDLRPPGHPLRHTILGNLAETLLIKSEVDGHAQDLESVASLYVSGLQLLSPGQEGYLFFLTSLGQVYWRLFSTQGNTEKMEMAIECFQTAMVHSTVPNLDHVRLLDTYSSVLRSRFTYSGNIVDLDQAIQYLTLSSNIQPPSYPDRPMTLFNLGTAFITRFNATGNITDLDSSIGNLVSAIQLCGPGYQQYHSILSIYGSALGIRFREKGDVEDLNLARSVCKEALELSSPKELNYLSTVSNLTSTLLQCLMKFGNMEECQIIIDYCDRALVDAQPSHPAFIPMKANRATAFLRKFRFGREETDVRTSVDGFREIIPMLHEGNAEYVPVHLNFGIAIQSLFIFSSDMKDLDESITHYRIAQRHSKRGDMNYVPICIQLGSGLHERFWNENDVNSPDALDEAIVLLAEAEEILSPTPEQPDFKAALSNLSMVFFARFQSQRDRADLDAAIERMSRALALPALSEEFLHFFSLATLLSVRYDSQGRLEDLERSVQLFGTTLEQMPSEHLSRAMVCQNYGHALVKLADHRDPHRHLDAAIVLYTETLEHLTPSHTDQPIIKLRLAEVLYERARRFPNDDDLLSAIYILRAVMRTLSKDNPQIHTIAHHAATLSMDMYKNSQDSSYMEDSFRYYEQAAKYTRTPGFQSVSAALQWMEYAEKLGHPSALLAYQTSLESLNQYLLGTASIKSRRAALLHEKWVMRTGRLATDAAACAIGQGELRLAVELSEQGRGLLWSQLSRSQTTLDALRSTSDVGQTLASDFERVSVQVARSTVGESLPRLTETVSRLTMEEATRRYKQLSKELDNIIVRIRQQPGFEAFLDRPSFESLKCAAVSGPVILVNVNSSRCDALIVLHDKPLRLVPLPDATLEDLTALSTQLHQTLRTTMRVGDEKTRERQIVVVLRTLWDCIVRPVVDDLATFLPRGSRIWWCPTSKLTSLPLHAAGPYRKGEQNLPNLYVSSYTPTLAALVRARQGTPSSSPPSFLAVSQSTPTASNAPQLQTLSQELTLVQSLVPSSMPFRALSDNESSADAVLDALRTHAWAHLACHGHPDVEQPFDSAFELRDRAVTVLDVVRARGGMDSAVGVGGGSGDPDDRDQSERGNGDKDIHTIAPTSGEFAFLSACHTAVGDPRAPDEIVHLAAAMQFAGFRSVIGTMWAVDDGMAPEMVGAFYTCMNGLAKSGEGGGEAKAKVKARAGAKEDGEGARQPEPHWDYTHAARALNRAAKTVDKDVVSIDQRVVFIHIGA